MQVNPLHWYWARREHDIVVLGVLPWYGPIHFGHHVFTRVGMFNQPTSMDQFMHGDHQFDPMPDRAPVAHCVRDTGFGGHNDASLDSPLNRRFVVNKGKLGW